MPKDFTSMRSKLISLCQPNPKHYPDPATLQLVRDRNIMNLNVIIVFVTFSIGCSIYCQFSLLASLFAIGGSLAMLFLFLLLCKTSLLALTALYMLTVTVFGCMTLEMIGGAPYLYLGLLYIFLPWVIIMGGNGRLSVGAGVVQILVCVTKLEEKLAILVQNEAPEIFASRFVKMTILISVLRILANSKIFNSNAQKTAGLSIAKMTLENALDQQKTFIWSFSHELRNPINSLLGNLQLVLQGEHLSAKAKEMINVAKVCGELLLHNINNVLDTGKHEIGKLELNPVPTHLQELFQRTWNIYGELLRQKKLQSQLKLEKTLPAVAKIDSHKVNQILLNLIGNSIKFTQKGSVTVTIKWLQCREVNEKCFEPTPYDEMNEGVFEKEENFSRMHTSKVFESKSPFYSEPRPTRADDFVYPEQESKGVLKIIVKDTGPGMNKEALEKLFKKFSQVSDNVSQRQIGSGLGLFITKEICLAMNGDIRAFSKVGLGTTVVACIPTTAMPMARRARVDSDSMKSQLAGRRLKAIVADDSPFNVTLVCDYLSKFETTVVSVAYNGHDAFLKYQACKIANVQLDLVLLDIDMPVMDGKTACDKIREYEEQHQLKPVGIILISGNYDKEQIDEYINPEKGHKADAYLRKPVSVSDFNQAVYNLIYSGSR